MNKETTKFKSLNVADATYENFSEVMEEYKEKLKVTRLSADQVIAMLISEHEENKARRDDKGRFVRRSHE